MEQQKTEVATKDVRDNSFITNEVNQNRNQQAIDNLDEMLRVRDSSRKKKDGLVSDLKERQTLLYLETGGASKYQSEYSRENKMNQNYSENQSCCWYWPFKFNMKLKNRKYTEQMQANEFEQEQMKLSIGTEDRKKLKEINSDEWLKYIVKNLNQMSGLKWSDNLTKLIKHRQESFKSNKFRQHLYYMKFSNNELQFTPLRHRILSPSSLERIQNQNRMTMQPNDQEKDLPISQVEISRKSDIGIRAEPSQRKSNDLASSSHQINQSQSDLYSMGDLNQKKIEPTEPKSLYLQSMEEAQSRIDVETLESMTPKVKFMFEIIRQQLYDKDHPLNLIAAGFGLYYSLHYTNQIIKDEKTNDYYLIKEVIDNEFEIQYISESQRQKIESSLIEFGFENDDDEFDVDDHVLLTEGVRMTNRLSKKTIRQASFTKHSSPVKLRSSKQIHYKSAQDALSEVKQFLCLMYGSAVRYYSTIVKVDEMDNMKEDIIEILTRVTFSEKMSKLAVAFCRISTKDEERVFTMKANELQKVKPSQIGLSNYFTLDKSSKIKEMLYEMKMQIENNGDMGGSSTSEQKKTDHGSLTEHVKDLSKVNAITEEDEEQQEEEEKQPVRKINKKLKMSYTHLNETSDHENQYARDYSESEDDDEIEMKEGKDDLSDVPVRPSVQALKLQRLSQKIEMRLTKLPYEQPISELKSINEVIAPLDKARCIVEVSQKIVKCINKFWKGMKVNKDKLTIDGDSLLMIYIYITIKAKIHDLFAQVKFMNEFSTPFVRNTKMGYCVTTLEISLNHILNLTKDDFVKSQEEPTGVWTEHRRSLTKSFRESLSLSSRAASLLISDDPYNNGYFKFEKNN